MASPEEVEETLARLMRRFQQLDAAYKAVLPSRRTVEAEFPDLALTYHATWRAGDLSELKSGRADRADIRFCCDSDDLIAMANGELALRRAWATNRLRVEASMTDLLRLRGVL